jgi:hypothetical protein
MGYSFELIGGPLDGYSGVEVCNHTSYLHFGGPCQDFVRPGYQITYKWIKTVGMRDYYQFASYDKLNT